MIATLNAADDAQAQLREHGATDEEVCMVRATAFLAVAEAARKGMSRGSFRRFHVDAIRWPESNLERSLMRVELVVLLDGRIIARDREDHGYATRMTQKIVSRWLCQPA